MTAKQKVVLQNGKKIEIKLLNLTTWGKRVIDLILYKKKKIPGKQSWFTMKKKFASCGYGPRPGRSGTLHGNRCYWELWKGLTEAWPMFSKIFSTFSKKCETCDFELDAMRTDTWCWCDAHPSSYEYRKMNLEWRNVASEKWGNVNKLKKTG